MKIDFSGLQGEVKAEVALKELLNHFENEQDKCAYEGFITQVLHAIPKQMVAFLSLKSDCITVGEQRYDYADARARLLEKCNREELSNLLFAVGDQFGRVRSVEQYVKKAIYQLSVDE